MKKPTDLYNDLTQLKTPNEFERLLTDLCTPAELAAMSERWQVAKALAKGLSYRDISTQLGVSTTTVTRVARARNAGEGGYNLLLNRLLPQPISQSPENLQEYAEVSS